MFRTLSIALPRSSTALRPIPSTSRIVRQTTSTVSSQYTFKRAYIMAEHGHSKACCTIPPVVIDGYETKGKYETIGGLKTYTTGSSSATKGVLFVFDIFGYWPQTLQGADILASQPAPANYLVVMPDFFDDQPADISWFPPQNDEHKAKLGAFFQNQGAPPKTVGKVPAYLDAVQKQYPSVKEWGVVGFCWGGKIVSLLTSQEDGRFKVGAECHPAMLDPKDAEKIKVPIAILASKDEDANDVKNFEANLTGEKHVETFGDQVHGWMGARGKLSDDKVKSEYERGYKTVLEFFGKHL